MNDRCANCGEPLQGPFCSACGQENRNLARLTLGQILHDWLGDAFTFDSRLLRTLGPLVLEPGFLTREYLAGRRARYVPPLRLFVFLSLIMFLGLALTGARFAWRVEQDGQEVVAFDPRAGSSVTPAEEVDEDGAGILDDPEEISRRILDRAAQAMLVLVPVFAFFVWLLHRRRVPLYVPHLIFSLHLHSFAFLVMVVVCLVDYPFALENRFGTFLLILGMPPYLFLAQRRVYGGGRLAGLIRTAVLLVVHAVAWVALMLAVLGIVLALA